MGIYAEMVDMDEAFNALPYDPILVNQFNISIPEQKEEFRRHLYSHYKDAESIDTAASCHCGTIRDVHRKGVICDVCNTPVEITNEKAITPSMWIKAPEGIAALVSPEIWIMLDGALSSKECNFLDYLTNTDYSVQADKISSKDTKKKYDKLVEKNLGRGLNNFIERFDEIIEFLFSANIIDTNKGEFWVFIQENKHLFFPQYIPIPSKICFVVESTTSGVYIDEPIALGANAAHTIAKIYSSATALKSIKLQNLVAKALKSISQFHEVYDRTRIARKPGIMRKHVLGGRLDFTGRAVITSISVPHKYDDLYLPWGLSVQLFKYHIINKLLKRNNPLTGLPYSPNEALNFVYSNVLQYNLELDNIFKELIAEANGGRGPTTLLARNPTLQRGSIQQFYTAKIKSNIEDTTISLSVICLKSPNADFDGDQLNLTLILDNKLGDAFKRLAPHLWVLSLEEPHAISSNLELQGPGVDTISNWLHADYLTT